MSGTRRDFLRWVAQAGGYRAGAVAWSKVPYSLGFAAQFRNESGYSLLNMPDGPIYFAGEHLSRIGPWQEGAILSARRAAKNDRQAPACDGCDKRQPVSAPRDVFSESIWRHGSNCRRLRARIMPGEPVDEGDATACSADDQITRRREDR
jgi:Flavin containing amine oxidoreductase